MSWFTNFRHHIGLQVMLILAWVLLYQIAPLLEYSPHASLWYPPAALSFAALLLLGPTVLPALLTVVMLMSVLHLYQHQAASSVLYLGAVLPALAHALSYLAGTLILRWLIIHRKVLHIGTVVAFLILAACAAMLAAVAGAWSLYLTNVISQSERQAIWLGWWTGDLVAILSLSPLILLVLDKLTTNKLTALAMELFQHGHGPLKNFVHKLAICLILLLVAMLIASQVRAIEITFLILFISLPAMWLVYTESFWRSFSGLALISFCIVLLIALLDLGEYAAVYQFTIAMIAVSMLYGSVVPLLQVTNKKLEHHLQTDPLTGILSRQGFIEQVDVMLAHAARRRDRLCFAIIDLDHFKKVNDIIGHDVGDQVLQQVCSTLRQQLRVQDLLGRFGGDELMMLLPDTSAEEAIALCERLRHAIETLDIRVADVTLTISCGLCELLSREQFSQFFARADQSLLQAKQAGRNKVMFTPSYPI